MKHSSSASQPIDLAHLERTAVSAALAAGDVLLKYFNRPLQVTEKKDQGWVTQADLEAQEQAVSLLKKDFSHFGFLTEEAEREIGQSEGTWIIDPLDGTTNYIHRFPMFCVSIAAQWAGELQVGVIYHPILKDLYTAVKGQGAKVNGQRIYVSQTPVLKTALLTTGFGYHPRYRTLELKTLEKLTHLTGAIRRPGSAALDLAYTARGVFDGFWEQQLSAWDIAAGALLVREAGGQVTQYSGDPLLLESGEILASNGILHPALVEGIQSAIF